MVGPRQAGRLADCLDSLPSGAEVLVAPWGDDPPPVLDGRGARVLRPASTGNDARNAGVTGAHRDLVLLVDATQRVDAGAVEDLATRLTASPDPVVAGRGAASDASRLLWRRGSVPTFDPAHGRFPHAALPDTPPAADLTVVGHDAGPWATPFGTVPPVAGEVADLARLVAARPDAPWLADLLDSVGGAFLDDLEHADPTDVAALADALRRVPVAVLADLGVEDRLRLWLVAHGHHEAMSRLTVDRWFTRGQLPTRVEDGTVLAELPVPGVDVPSDVLAMPVRLEASLRRAVPVAGGWGLTVFASVRWVDLAEHAPTVTARAVHASGHEVALPVTPAPDPAATRHLGTAFQNHDSGAVRVDLPVAALDRAGRWRVEVTLDVAGLMLAGPLTDRDERGSAGVLADSPDAPARLSWDPAEGLVVEAGAGPGAASRPAAPYAVSVEVGDDLVVRVAEGPVGELDLCLGARRVPATLEREPEGTVAARFPLVVDDWGLGSRALPAGTWHVTWRPRGPVAGRGGELALSPGLVARTPYDLDAPDHRARLLRGLRGQLLLQLQPPLADDELGPWAQQRLRSAYVVTDRPVDPGLALFSSYAGTGATDSPRAILEELRHRHPDVRTRWVVADRSVLPPPGVEPVLLRSRAWYDALATAGTVVSNVETDRFFRTRPGQRLVQTFHGYPSKSMGLDLWRSKNHSPLRLALQLANTAGNWTVALTPTPAMDVHYREQYAYEGTILNRGYPRDDALVGPGAAERRAAARARLGLHDDQVAVLHAPTWRDDVATNFRAAPMVTHLDVPRAARALGDGHVLLLRGHRFHEPGRTGAGARVLDVTTYPEVNDLVLAADAAVLDYTSMRFDLALTGTPMVFLVPDLDRYSGTGRGFLYPFTDSAPGPLVATTDEAVTLLRDLPALRTAYADDLARFNATYNADQDGHAAARVVEHLWG
ncbi:hypothetical protein EKO23_04030 [Nocardioides guangzhouensis]|uniref:Glycosyltransferase n=1 Tax=Nocardioides guangzhouensis TaxID=2497878 RepID=A0A4Q4ZKI9_9ACTN|nr:CDP-glycerol glycerophosphotransferase family protein [Nocardioides guangzhouensis]RYP88026.1 hypothetical protein EKO23_04030 [Nocardioides guangzhouensis]